MDIVRKLTDDYELKREETVRRSREMAREADGLSKWADELEKKAQELRDRSLHLTKEADRMESVDWKKNVIDPLASALGERAKKMPLVYGPMGLCSRVSIYLVDDLNKKVYEQPAKCLVVQPDIRDDGGLSFVYETGEVADRYEKGTLGEVSGMNMVTAPLPGTIDEILALFRDT